MYIVSFMCCSRLKMAINYLQLLLLRCGWHSPPLEIELVLMICFNWWDAGGMKWCPVTYEVNYKKTCSICFGFFEYQFLEPNCHAVRKPKGHMERPPGKEIRMLSFQPAASTNLPCEWAILPVGPSASVEQRWAAPLHTAKIADLMSKTKDGFCFKPLKFGRVCCVAVGNWTTCQLCLTNKNSNKM